MEAYQRPAAAGRYVTCYTPWPCSATGRSCPRGACPLSKSRWASFRPILQRIIVLSQRRTQFSKKVNGEEVYRTLSVDSDTEFDNTPPVHTGTSLEAVQSPAERSIQLHLKIKTKSDICRYTYIVILNCFLSLYMTKTG